MLLGTLAVSAQVSQFEAPGRNSTTIETRPDGGSTVSIKCDNFYQEVCYKLTVQGPVKTQIAHVQYYSYSLQKMMFFTGKVVDLVYNKKGLDAVLESVE